MTTFIDINGNVMPAKPFTWSYSALSNYRTCPLKFFHYFVKKDIKEPENDNMRWGFQVHEAMAARISKFRRLPENMPYEKWADWALENSDRTQVEVHTERRLAFTEQFTPCDYFDKQKQVWHRAVLDVLKLRQSAGVARIIDWKTGKVPVYADKADEAMQQLGLAALCVFIHYPEINEVLMQLVYLQDDVKAEEVITRADIPMLWRGVMPELQRMIASYETQKYDPKPSGLCKAHCAVTSCKYHGKGSY